MSQQQIEIQQIIKNYDEGNDCYIRTPSEAQAFNLDLIINYIATEPTNISSLVIFLRDYEGISLFAHLAKKLALDVNTIGMTPQIFEPFLSRIFKQVQLLQAEIFQGNQETTYNSILEKHQRKVSESTNDRYLNKGEFGIARLINKIYLKSQQFTQRGDAQANDDALKLYYKLQREFKTYLDSPKDQSGLDEFRSNSKRFISECSGTLKEHRGWKNFLANLIMHIGLFVTTAGIGNAVALGISYAQGNKNLMFPLVNTDSQQQLNNLDGYIQNFSIP